MMINRLRLPVLFLLFAVLSFSCRKKTVPYPHAVVSQTAYDFSQVTEGSIVSHGFDIRNNGTQPLLIEGILSPCRCIFARVKNRKVKPGEEITLLVKLNTKGIDGAINHRVIVYTNAPQQHALVFRIKASIQRLFTLKPDKVDFGNIKPNKTNIKAITFTSSGIHITSVASISPYVKAFIQKQRNNRETIKVKLDSAMPAGLLKTTILVYTTAHRNSVIKIPVRAKVVSNIQANPDKIFAGIIIKGKRSSVLSIYLFSKHKTPFTIKGIHDTKKFLNIKREKLAPDIYKIDISSKPFDHVGDYTSDILVSTTDKQSPLIQIPFRVKIMME